MNPSCYQIHKSEEKKVWVETSISRYEQAPGSGFHPRDESDKSDFEFLGPPWCNKKVGPEKYVSLGLYELLVSSSNG